MTTLLLALDTATERTTVGFAGLDGGTLTLIAEAAVDARRAAMSRVLPMVESLLDANGLVMGEVGGVIVGCGPGSFTGVRIGVATAKGLAQGLGAPLWGVGTLDAVAWSFAEQDVLLGVVGDAMRGEVYPALFECGGGDIRRLSQDVVAKPADVAVQWAALDRPILLAGGGLAKYAPVLLEALGKSATLSGGELWQPFARGLFGAYGVALRERALGCGDPATVLPVYTRLSDAEENERLRVGMGVDAPASGVAGAAPRVSPRAGETL